MHCSAVGRFLLILVLSTQLLACGFHLRQEITLPATLQLTSLKGVGEYSELGLALQREFQHAGYPLLGDAEEVSADTVIHVSKEKLTRRVLSIDQQGRANEYELKYLVMFKLKDATGMELVTEQSIQVFRSYRYNPDQVLAKATEEARLKKDMASYVARQMMRRIIRALKQTAGKPAS